MSFLLHTAPALLEVNVSLNGENIDLFLNEDTDGDGTPENVEKINLQDGQNTYSLSKITPESSNHYWVELYFLNSDITSSPVTKSVKLKGRNWNQEHDWNYSQKETAVSHENIANTDHANDTNVRHGNPYASINSGLIAYYPMERNQSTHLHDAALNHPGDINGATWTTGKVGSYALSFNGSSDYVECGTGSKKIIRDWTLTGWVYHNNWGNSDRESAVATEEDNTSSSTSPLNFDKDGANEFAHYRGDAAGQVLAYSSVSSGWHHFAVTQNRTSSTNVEVELFFDGKSRATNSGDYENMNLKEFVIGAAKGSSVTAYWNGKIDDVRLYERVLSPTEVKTLYNLTKNTGKKKTETPSPDPVAYYKLDGNAKDSAGSNDGTVNGATETTNAIQGTALSFDGSDDYVDIPNSFGIFGGSYSVSVWWTASGSEDTDRHLIQFGGENDVYPFYYDSSAGVYQFRMYDGANNGVTVSPSNITNDGTVWYHTVSVWDGSTMELYLDGISQGTAASGAPNSQNNDSRIGSTNNDPWGGTIDNVRIYDRALTPLEVEKLYHYGSYRISRKQVLNR